MTVTQLAPYKIGGSLATALLGLDPWLPPYAAAVQLVEGRSGEAGEAADIGREFERFHRRLLRREGYDLAPADPAGYTHPEIPWLHVHPDAIVNGLMPAELKLRGVAPNDRTLARDTMQLLVYVHTLDAPQGVLSELHGGLGGFKRVEQVVERDDELFAVAVERLDKILANIARGHLPAPSGAQADREALRSRYAEGGGGTVRLTQEAWAHLRRGREFERTAKQAKLYAEREYEHVQAEMGDATHAFSPYDELAVRWNVTSSTRVDTTALRRAHPEIAEEFAKSTTTRRWEPNP